MSVLFDHQIFAMQVHGGISRYFAALMHEYQTGNHGVRLANDHLWTKNQHLMEVGLGRRLPTRIGTRTRVLQLLNSRVPTPAPDLVHHTYYENRYLQKAPKGVRRAITVHDMIPEIYPELFPRGNPHLQKAAYVEAADVIFCVSESTKRDLCAYYGEPGGRLVVTPLGVDARFSPAATKPPGLPKRYVLFVGSRSGYKDFRVLVEAFAMADLPGDVHLLAAGGGKLTPDETRLLVKSGITRRVRQQHFTDAELRGAYANALCFVFPSRYEGFGLPTLEAMASGCPAVLASSSSHLEVGGDSAVYFPPGDALRLAQVLTDVAVESHWRAQLSRRGLARARTFTWKRTAELTARGYLEVTA